MHILIATPLSPPQAGGPSYYSEGLAEGFRALGHSVDVVSFGTYRTLPVLLRHLRFGYALVRPLRTADITIALDTWSVAVPTVLLGRLLGKFVVVRSGGDFLWERFVERTHHEVTLSEFYTTSQPLSLYERFVRTLTRAVVFSLPNRVVCSTTWQRDILAHAYDLPAARTSVIENVLPARIPARSVGSEQKRYLWVGRPLFLKNTARLKQAYERARTTHPDIELTLLSNISHDEVLALLPSTWALVLPSLSEVSPNLALEALACGIPVILTRETGLSDHLRELVYPIDPRSTAGLAEALVHLADPSERKARQARIAAHPWSRTYRDIAREYLVLCEA